MIAEDYAKTALQWGKALKLLDPKICLILCGRDRAFVLGSHSA
jgi:alpha-N-arabinofuranosidase